MGVAAIVGGVHASLFSFLLFCLYSVVLAYCIRPLDNNLVISPKGEPLGLVETGQKRYGTWTPHSPRYINDLGVPMTRYPDCRRTTATWRNTAQSVHHRHRSQVFA
ncbi:hypothetical protein J3E69DRAFT_322524 [Trichoderma sp. SZMC 28015]